MIPAQVVVNAINLAAASDNTFWGTIAPNAAMVPIINPFVPSAQLQQSDVVQAGFAGSSPILIPIPPQTIVNDSVSGRVGVLLKEPAGGYRWVCTTAPATPETVYGWVIIDSTLGTVWWSELLPAPKTITNVGDFVEVTAILGFLQINPYGDLDPSL